MRLPALAAVLLLLAGLSFAAGSADIHVLPDVPVILTAGNESALAILHSPTSNGTDAAFIAQAIVVKDGALLSNGDSLTVVYDSQGLKQIKAGSEPNRDAWMKFGLMGALEGVNITQTVYSSSEGYEANFEPSIPFSAAGKRIWIEYANDYWLIGDMDVQNRSVLLYREAAFGRIDASRNLSYGNNVLSFVSYDGESVLVRFRGGLEPTYFAVQAFNDIASRRLMLWVDYNSTQGPLAGADCFLEGDITGSLSLINNRYTGQLDYLHLPLRTYSYAVSCSKEGYEPKVLVLSLDATAPAAVPASPQAAPSQIGAAPAPYLPQPEQPTLLQMLDRLIHDPFWWLRGS
ncbi:MAG: hypothetical protein WC759_00435 [Candidatus Micrarchaeia archaeon]|jgi:hypothetical protein